MVDDWLLLTCSWRDGQLNVQANKDYHIDSNNVNDNNDNDHNDQESRVITSRHHNGVKHCLTSTDTN